MAALPLLRVAVADAAPPLARSRERLENGAGPALPTSSWSAERGRSLAPAETGTADADKASDEGGTASSMDVDREPASATTSVESQDEGTKPGPDQGAVPESVAPAPARSDPSDGSASSFGPRRRPGKDGGAQAPGASAQLEVPRVDGPYLGWTLGPAAHLARVQNLDTPAPLIGPTAQLHAGQSVFRWMTIGVHIIYGAGFTGTQRLMHGGLLAELGFLPRPKTPLSIRAGFGVGFGAVRDSTIPNRRFGFGGAMFRGALRYEFFPGAAKRRPSRAGGFAIGPELAWIGETPNQPNGPMNNTVMLGLHSAFYFGD